MNSKRKIEINIVEVQTYKILIQINSNKHNYFELNFQTRFSHFDVYHCGRANCFGSV